MIRTQPAREKRGPAPIRAMLYGTCIIAALVGCDDGSPPDASPDRTGVAFSDPAPLAAADPQQDEYCGDPSTETATTRLRADSPSGDYMVDIEPFAQPVPSNEIYGLELMIHTSEGISPQDLEVRVDAAMPHHGHGMSVVPRASRIDGEAGAFRITGMMFHMPGSWELYVDISDGPYTERVTFHVQAQ